MSYLPDLDWFQISHHLLKITVAYLFTFPMAWNRERQSNGAGLRTLPLVGMASCGFVLIGLSVLEGSESHARILYGIMTGIGFIGGGAIMKKDSGTAGTATAASIWNSGAIGAAVAWNRYEIALVLSLVNFLTLKYFMPIKDLAKKSS